MKKEELAKIEMQLNQTIMSLDMNYLPVGLFNGKMGLCIYFFYLAKIKNNEEYSSYAENLLKNIYSSTNNISTIHFHVGLSGIAWGIQHLIEKGFVTGRVNSVLQQVDDLLFRTIHFDWLNDKELGRSDFLWLLFYYADRLRTIENKTEKYLAQKTVINILNHIEDYYSDSSWDDPIIFNMDKYDLPFYLLVLSKIYSYNFFNYKIIKILEGISNRILSSMPALHVNRLFLLLGMESILAYVKLPEWGNHINLLRNNIDHKRIIDEEFLNKNITLRRGIAGYVLLLMVLKKENLCPKLKNDILMKIETSEVWETRFNPLSNAIGGNIDLANGYAGTALIYNFLLNS